MDNLSNIDELIDYTQLVIRKIKGSKNVMSLIADDPDIDLNSNDAVQWEDHIYDYNWVPNTVQESGSFVMVDTIVTEPGEATKTISIYVQIVCSKDCMKLSPEKFSLKGNRRDNIARFIDIELNGSREFGIGRLELVSTPLEEVPEAFTSRTLRYEARDYKRERVGVSLY